MVIILPLRDGLPGQPGAGAVLGEGAIGQTQIKLLLVVKVHLPRALEVEGNRLFKLLLVLILILLRLGTVVVNVLLAQELPVKVLLAMLGLLLIF